MPARSGTPCTMTVHELSLRVYLVTLAAAWMRRSFVFCHTRAHHTATRYPDAQGVGACPTWDLIPWHMSGDFPYSRVRAMHILLGCNQIYAVLCASPTPCSYARTEGLSPTVLGKGRRKRSGPFLSAQAHHMTHSRLRGSYMPRGLDLPRQTNHALCE